MGIFVKYIAGWLGLVVLAIINGVLREKSYGRIVSELTAHQISMVSAMLLFGVYVFWLTGFWPLASAGQALNIGILWLGLTVAFEFLFGHYIMGHTWSKLLHDYNLLKGRLWLLILIWTTVAPYVFYRIHR